ncbi:MAG: MGH1-like glycoside hydrolase domain-containing protein, partial [Planctomycetota bacterium]
PKYWWQLDSNVSLGGAKWVNQDFAENVIRGFIGAQAQNADGRIDHSGHVPTRGGCYNLSSLPRYFEAAYDVARRSSDKELREAIFESMRKYHQWWLSPVKRDAKTGLVTGWYEETISYTIKWDQLPATIAPVDLNVAVALGSDRIARLADQLGHKSEAKKYRQIFREHVRAINQYLWDAEDGVYYPYNVKTNQRESKLIASIFDTFRLEIAGSERIQKLIPKLTDPELFNWGILPLTTAAKTHPDYSPGATGCYAAWFGCVWTMRNLPIIDGLVDIGRHDLAGELSWQTIKAFNGRYAEFLNPVTGKAGGDKRYGWSASLYIQAIIEYLFGVAYDLAEGRLRIFPHIPEELADKTISIEKLILPARGDTRLKLTISPDQATGGRLVDITIDGELVNGMNIEVLQPQTKNQPLPEVLYQTDGVQYEIINQINLANVRDMETVVGIRSPMCRSLKVRFAPKAR